MAVQIFKDGQMTYVEPDSLHAHLATGWQLEESFSEPSFTSDPTADAVSDITSVLINFDDETLDDESNDALKSDIEAAFKELVTAQPDGESESQAEVPRKRGRPRKSQ